MSLKLRLILIVASILYAYRTLKKIRDNQLRIEFVVFWVLFSFVIILMGVFPELFYAISAWLGFDAPISMVYLIIIFLLIQKTFQLTLNISKLTVIVNELTQKIALKEKNESDQERK